MNVTRIPSWLIYNTIFWSHRDVMYSNELVTKLRFTLIHIAQMQKWNTNNVLCYSQCHQNKRGEEKIVYNITWRVNMPDMFAPSCMEFVMWNICLSVSHMELDFDDEKCSHNSLKLKKWLCFLALKHTKIDDVDKKCCVAKFHHNTHSAYVFK